MNYIISIISFIAVFGSFGVIIWRVLENSGVKIKKKVSSPVLLKPEEADSIECIKIFFTSFAFRIFVVIAAAFVLYLFSADNARFSISEILKSWVKWDASNYIRISDGYASYQESGKFTTLVFYPLYPFFLNIVNNLIPSVEASGLLLSAVFYSSACVILYKLVCIDYGKSVAEKAVVLLSVFPFAFFHGAIMSESAFILTSLLTLYYIRRHNWMLAGFCGMLAALSRSAGVFLIIPATVEFVEEYKFFEKKLSEMIKLVFTKWIWLLLLPIGIVIYLIINYIVAGDPFEFLHLEDDLWYQQATPFFKTLGNMWNILTSGYKISFKTAAILPGLVSALTMIGVLVYGVRKHRSMYTAWLLVYIMINTSISWPMSIGRYMASAVPAFIILAEVCEKNKKLFNILTVIFSIFFAIYLAGYITGKQIM